MPTFGAIYWLLRMRLAKRRFPSQLFVLLAAITSIAAAQSSAATSSDSSVSLTLKEIIPAIPAVATVIAAVITALVAILTMHRSSQLQRARELEVARRNAEFKQTEALVAYRLRQMEHFYAPMFAYLNESKALYKKLNTQLVIEHSDLYELAPETYTGQFLLIKQPTEERGKAFRLLDKMPGIRSKTSQLLVEEIVGIGVKMEEIIAKHAGLAAMDHTDTTGLSPTDIVNPLSLAYKLRHPDEYEIAKSLVDRLSPRTRTLIPIAVQGSQFELQAAFTDDLNRLIRANRPLLEEGLIAKVKFHSDGKLDADIKTMLTRPATGEDLVRQNRYALERAFPDEISTTHIVDLLGEYLAHIAVLKQLLRQCKEDPNIKPYRAGWHQMGYYPRSLNAKIEAGYRELTTFLAKYSDQGSKVLDSYSDRTPVTPSILDQIERVLDRWHPPQGPGRII